MLYKNYRILFFKKHKTFPLFYIRKFKFQEVKVFLIILLDRTLNYVFFLLYLFYCPGGGMVYTGDLKSPAARLEGSSPSLGTRSKARALREGREQIGGLQVYQNLSPIWCPENFILTKLKFSRERFPPWAPRRIHSSVGRATPS